MSDGPVETKDTVLSYLLRNAPRDRIPADASPQNLHPFAYSSPDDPLAVVKNLVDVSATLSRTLQAYSSLATSDHKLVSILRQSTTLIENLHTSQQDTCWRVKALKSRTCIGSATIYGEPIPLENDAIVKWCVSGIEEWGRLNGMEVFKEEEDRDGRITIMLGGKILVVDVDLLIQRSAPSSPAPRIIVSNVKTSHALPSGNSGNALAERSGSLDAFILRSWNDYLAEVQKNDVDSSMCAARISKDIQGHLSYLMKLDDFASREGDQGIRWFNDTGLMSAVTDRISKTEVDALSVMLHTSTVNLDIFLSRAHALAVPYLVSPSMSFLVYLSPLAYYSLLRVTEKDAPNIPASGNDATDAFAKLDIPLSILREKLIQRHVRSGGAVIAVLTLVSVSSILSLERRPEQRPNAGRPHFRLPGTSVLNTLDHVLLAPPCLPTKGTKSSLDSMRDLWVLDFTDNRHLPGIVMTHSRMRDIQQVIDPLSTGGGVSFAMQMPPLPGSWVGLLMNPTPTFPPSERYIATYESPSKAHPPLRLRLTAPNEAGFLLRHVPVTSLKEIYGVLEIVREQCWINEILGTVNWVPEDLMPETEDERNDGDAMSASEELEALLKGTYTPRRVPVNVFLPLHPPFISEADAAGGLDLDADHSVPGLTSVSMSVGGNTPPPCIALAFVTHESSLTGSDEDASSAHGARQVALVLRHDRARRRGVRVDISVNATPPSRFGNTAGDRPPPEFMEELEEASRRGGAFGAAGKVWSWLVSRNCVSM